MNHELDPLILDLLEWIEREPRTYVEVIDAWRTSCPRLTVWEDCVDWGLVVRDRAAGHPVIVGLTTAGREFLTRNRPANRAVECVISSSTSTASEQPKGSSLFG